MLRFKGMLRIFTTLTFFLKNLSTCTIAILVSRGRKLKAVLIKTDTHSPSSNLMRALL